jgi:MerR family transcriptional regulator, light-induced transcriptional regulator
MTVTTLLPGADARRLARAAADLDTELIARIVQNSVDSIGAISTWEQLIQPVWHHLAQDGDVAELLFVQAARRALSTGRRRPVAARPSVLLACADEELQAFPLEALIVSLEESGTSCCTLGARVPPQALAAATARLQPAVVVIWSQTRDTAAATEVRTVAEARPATTIVAAGPGWTDAPLSSAVLRPTDLSTALVLILAILEGGS